MDTFAAELDDLIDREAAGLTRSERRDQQTRRILEAAKSCFVRSGFQGASMQQICAECGMSPGALYRYFPSKESLVEAICAADRQEDVEGFLRLMGNPSIVDGVVGAAVAHLQQVHECGKAPMFAEIRAVALRNESIRAIFEACLCPVEEVFRDKLSAAIELGEIDPIVDLDALVATLMAIGEGMALSDLPAQGVGYEKIEAVFRAMTVSLLRPTGKAA